MVLPQLCRFFLKVPPALSAFVGVQRDVSPHSLKPLCDSHGSTPGTTTPGTVDSIGASPGSAGTKSTDGAPHRLHLKYLSTVSIWPRGSFSARYSFTIAVCASASASDITKCCLLYTSPSPRD